MGGKGAEGWVGAGATCCHYPSLGGRAVPPPAPGCLVVAACRRIHEVIQPSASSVMSACAKAERPWSASQSASSFPGTRICERTCRSSTSPGRRRCTRRHNARSFAMRGAFRRPCLRGIHRPVVMCMAYSELRVYDPCVPAGRPRAAARSTWRTAPPHCSCAPPLRCHPWGPLRPWRRPSP